MNEESRYIPAKIRREVLLESGHSCAIPTCQFPATEFAHIEPYSKVKKHEACNIVALCPNHHTMYDIKKEIDKKSIKIYKQNLQFLNKRYTKYEMRILRLLTTKQAVLASGEIETMGLLSDGLIYNAKTFSTQSIIITNNISGKEIFNDVFTTSFAAALTDKGKDFISIWEGSESELIDEI